MSKFVEASQNKNPVLGFEVMDAYISNRVSDYLIESLRSSAESLFGIKSEALNEVQAPNARPDRAMAAVNPIVKYQLFKANPSTFISNLPQAPARLADSRSEYDPVDKTGDRRKVLNHTADAVRAVKPDFAQDGTLSNNLPDHEFDPDVDSEEEFYPIFSSFQINTGLAAPPDGEAR